MADTPDLNQLTNLTTQQRAGTQGLLAGQNTATADYLKRYTDFINSQEGASAMAGRIGQELGIPTLQSNATMLRNTLTNLPSTYSKATTGYDVNQNQLSRIVGQKSSELAPAVTTAETSLANAQNVLGQRMGYEQIDQARLEKPFATEKDFLADRLARETTLYSQDNQNELNALITKIQTGVTLSEGEKNRANQLALQEKQYQQALETAKIQTGGSGYMTVGEGSAVYDPVTGKMLYKNPKTYQASQGTWG
ncbi:MAG: hypothetical protein LAN71_17710 [Acidobacteriia bacterium]|nr:hypothetical protein [Terriglobia bacterium]